MAGFDVRRVAVERRDARGHLAGELLEDEVLVLHLVDEPGGLEDPLAVPAVGAGAGAVRELPVAQRCRAAGVAGQHALDLADQPVVLGVEDLVDGAERDVLVAAAVAAGEVRVQHLVVVGAGGLGREVGGRGVVGVRGREGVRHSVVVRVDLGRVGVVRDVGDERRADVEGVGRHRHRVARSPSTRPDLVTYCGSPWSGRG